MISYLITLVTESRFQKQIRLAAGTTSLCTANQHFHGFPEVCNKVGGTSALYPETHIHAPSHTHEVNPDK